jgi:hypothetical protein
MADQVEIDQVRSNKSSYGFLNTRLVKRQVATHMHTDFRLESAHHCSHFVISQLIIHLVQMVLSSIMENISNQPMETKLEPSLKRVD